MGTKENLMFRHILATTDGSAHGDLALPFAADLARRYGAALTLLYVVPPPVLPPEVYLERRSCGYGPKYDYEEARERLLEDGLSLLDRARKQMAFPEARVRCRETEGRSVAEVIADEVECEGTDLVVMSTHGRTGLAHLCLGSVAEAVLHTVRVPVFLVRAPVKTSPDSPAQRREAPS